MSETVVVFMIHAGICVTGGFIVVDCGRVGCEFWVRGLGLQVCCAAACGRFLSTHYFGVKEDHYEYFGGPGCDVGAMHKRGFRHRVLFGQNLLPRLL